MTNFIYNMQDELFHLNMILPVGEFSPIKKLVDHIEAQGKQLRELNTAITKRNATIAKYEREKEELQKRNNYLGKKVNELNEGIRDSEDLTWKQKYDALLHGSEQAIAALQKKCQEYKNGDELLAERDTLRNENNELKEEVNLYVGLCSTKHEEIEALAKAVRCPWGNTAEIISSKTAHIKELEEKNKKLERANLDLGDTIGLYVEEFNKLKEDLEKEKQVSKDLNVIINSKNKLLDEYMTKCNNLEHNYKEEVRMKEQFKTICFRHERTIESQNSTIKYLKGKVADYIRFDNGQNDEIKKLKYDNDTLRGRAKEISDLAESIMELCEEEEE